MKVQNIKILFVGDFRVGKTLLLLAYVKNAPQHDVVWISSIYRYAEGRKINGKDYDLFFDDTLGGSDELSDRLRPLAYVGTQICLICFSLVDIISYENVRTKWYPELKRYSPDSMIVLVGTKKDLRDGILEGVGNSSASRRFREEDFEERTAISLEQGVGMAREIGAEKYMECSAFTGEGVKAIFVESVDWIVPKVKTGLRSHSGCVIV